MLVALGGFRMNIPASASPATVMRNLRLLAGDWRAASAQARYFIASQLLSCLLLAACALGAVASAAAGDSVAYTGLVVAAGACLVHTVATWLLLKRRFRVRYAIW
jgi:hypothetical protein